MLKEKFDDVYGGRNLNFVFLITAFFHLFIDGILFGFERQNNFWMIFFIYMFIALFASLVFKSNDGDNTIQGKLKRYALYLLISLAAIYIPILKIKLVQIINPSNTVLVIIHGVLLFTAVWPLYIWKSGELSGSIVPWIANAYVTVWFALIVSLILFEFYNYSELMNLKPKEGAPIDVGEVLVLLKDKTTSAFNAGKEGVKTIPGKVGNSTQNYLNKATGQETYRGEVEKNVKEDIGIKIGKIETTDPKLYESQKIALWGLMSGKTYQADKSQNSITVIPSCVADRETDKPKNGTVRPAKFVIDYYDEVYVDCEFPVEKVKDKTISLPFGSHSVTFEALFNFNTNGYKKSYFIDSDFSRSMKREDIDVYKQYGLEKSPKSIYTNGPIEIGISAPEFIALEKKQEVSVEGENQEFQQISVGFSLINRWGGELKELNSVSLEVPRGLLVDYCTENLQSAKVSDDSDFTRIEFDKKTYKKNTNDVLQTFRCTFNVTQKDALLEAGPINTRYFNVKASYSYLVRKTTTIDVSRIKEETQITNQI